MEFQTRFATELDRRTRDRKPPRPATVQNAQAVRRPAM